MHTDNLKHTFKINFHDKNYLCISKVSLYDIFQVYDNLNSQLLTLERIPNDFKNDRDNKCDT